LAGGTIYIIEIIVNAPLSNYPDSLTTLAKALAYVLLALVIGILFAGLFPEIRIMDNGLKYRVIFFKGLITWNEIEEVILFPSGYAALIISRKGFFLFNGLYFNKLYGHIIRHEQPVLFLSSRLENLKEVLQIIGNKSNAKIIQRSEKVWF
jgi:hypothetical protein